VDISRILVIATRQIGDVLLTTPLIDAVRRRWPDAQIDVLGFKGTLGMLRGHPALHEMIEVQPGSGWRQARQLLPRIWRRYDLALVTQATDRAFFYGFAASGRRSGLLPQRRSISWWKKLMVQHGVTIDDETTPTVVEKLSLLDPWAERPERVEVTPPPAEALPAEIASLLRERYVVVHAPSMWRYKQWPLEHFATVIRTLLDRGLQVVLSGSASEADQAAVAGMRHLGQSPQLIDASGRLNLNQLGTLLRGAALYVGPDTSITHLAAACGTPLVTVFGPTNPVRWGPWPQAHGASSPWQRAQPRQVAGKVIVLQADQACIACGRAGCDDRHDSRSLCLEATAPERVIRECLQLLGLAADPPAAVSAGLDPRPAGIST
jgi:heptosyltransferase-3